MLTPKVTATLIRVLENGIRVTTGVQKVAKTTDARSQDAGRKMLRIGDMCLRYGISKKTWVEWRHKGDVPPSFKVGSITYWDPTVVEAWEAKRTEKAS